jgi:hypothetical protein
MSRNTMKFIPATLLLLTLPLWGQDDDMNSIHGRMAHQMRQTTSPAEAAELLSTAVTAHDTNVILVALQNPNMEIQVKALQTIRQLPKELSAPLWMEALSMDSLWACFASTEPPPRDQERDAFCAMLRAGVREDYGVDPGSVDLSDSLQRGELTAKVLTAFHAAQKEKTPTP